MAAATVVEVTVVEVISVEVMAEAQATALAVCISVVATTPVRGSPHIHFREGAFAAAILLPVMAEGTSARSETPRCDPEASAAL